MSRTDRLPPFAISRLEEAVILTVLLPELTVNNASWFKDHVADFVTRFQPSLLVINLINVKAVDRLGIGIMISLNTQLKQQTELYFAGLQPSVDEHLQSMYLRHSFRVIDPGWPCLLCHGENCRHLADWDERLQQFIFVDDQPPEVVPPLSDLPGYQPEFEGLEMVEPNLEDVVAAFEQDPRYQALEYLRQQKLFWLKFRHYTAIGAMSTAFVVGAILVVLLGLNTRWLSLLDQAKSTMRHPKYDYGKNRVLEYHEIIDRFDKNGDGVFSKEDWVFLNSREKLELINSGFQERLKKNRSPFDALTR